MSYDNRPWHEQTIPIDGLKIIRLRESTCGEGFSLWIGECCIRFGEAIRDEAIKYAHKLENEILLRFSK